MQKIRPCLWFDKNGEKAAEFYVSLFPNSRLGAIARTPQEVAAVNGQEAGSVMIAVFELAGQEFAVLNGGSMYKFSPAVSLFVRCETSDEVERLYNQLSSGGSVLMELNRYPFAEKYAWVQDKFGLSWQLIYHSAASEITQKISPCVLFCGNNFGKAEEAIKNYLSIFPDSNLIALERYPAGTPQPEGAVAHAVFALNGYQFVATESAYPHEFSITGGISIMVYCETQEEIDHLWEKLPQNGGETIQCGWLVDKYGVTWQICPAALDRVMQSGDTEKMRRWMVALMPMTKLEIAKLEQAVVS